VNLQAIIFDLDGTLLDRRETFRRHVELQARRLRHLFAGTRTADLERIVALDDNGTVPRKTFFQRVETELELPRGSWSQLQADFEAHFPEECVPAPYLHTTLEMLHTAGLKLGLITNGRVEMQSRKIDGLGIRSWFRVDRDFGGRRRP
jgi:putative hydrolase of the HAD superfamily